MSTTTQASARPIASAWLRWGQLIFGVICMVMIANLQYGWTFFVPGIQKAFGWDRAAIQMAFTLFVLFETWLVPIEGWFVDKYGPAVVVFIGGVLCGIGWVMNSFATSLPAFYAAQIIAGLSGLERGATPPPMTTGDAYSQRGLPPLPASLEQALALFEGSSLATELLGDEAHAAMLEILKDEAKSPTESARTVF